MKTPVSIRRTFASILVTLGAAFAVPQAWADNAGSCHFHGNKPAAQETIIACAQQRKAALVKSGKLGTSWQDIKQDTANLVDGKKGKEWKVTFKDPAARDSAKETLFMFFTPAGNFIAANFTGQ
jgi:Family of unknown function (DUF6488)